VALEPQKRGKARHVEIRHHLLMLEGEDPDLVGIGLSFVHGSERQTSVRPCPHKKEKKEARPRRANRQTSDQTTGGEAAAATESLKILFVAASHPQNKNCCHQSSPSKKSVSVL
jgi:hypothetical protein